MTKSKGIRAPRRAWTPEQLESIRTRYPHERTENIAADLDATVQQIYSRAVRMGLSKTQEYLNSPEACRLRRGDNIGAAYRFPKGHVPINKGKKGVNYPGMQATQFKKGQHPHTWRPIGTERLSKEGYLQIKLHDTGVTRRDYVPVHHLVWELHRGAIPEKHHVSFKDGNKTNIIIENLELVSWAEMMQRNTLHNYPKEIAQCIQLRGVINRKINRRLKNEQRTDE